MLHGLTFAVCWSAITAHCVRVAPAGMVSTTQQLISTVVSQRPQLGPISSHGQASPLGRLSSCLIPSCSVRAALCALCALPCHPQHVLSCAPPPN
jgi:hypothetical protein